MIEIFHEFRFEAAHSLPNVPEGHPCGRLHGHSYTVTLYLRGSLDPELQWVCDYADLQKAMDPLLEQLDHHFLNEVPGLENSTAEVIAGWFAEKLRPALPGLHRLTVQETPATGATIYLD